MCVCVCVCKLIEQYEICGNFNISLSHTLSIQRDISRDYFLRLDACQS